LNVASNWDAINQNGFDFGKFAASAAVGAASSALSFLGPVGWGAGGFVSGFSNTFIQGGNIGEAMGLGLSGAATSFISGYAGRFVDKNISTPIIDKLGLHSPVVSGFVGGAIGGMATGGATGIFFGEGEVTERVKNGAIRGGLLGGSTGAVSAGLAAHEAGYNPLLGKPYENVVREPSLQLIVKEGEAAKSSRVLNYTQKSLQKKYMKHAADFGITDNWNKAAAGKFSSTINQHINSPGIKVIQGTYKNQPAIHYLNPNTGLNVISRPNGQFWSGWKLGPQQLEGVLNNGTLW